jgi:hypothetical protein
LRRREGRHRAAKGGQEMLEGRKLVFDLKMYLKTKRRFDGLKLKKNLTPELDEIEKDVISVTEITTPRCRKRLA